MTKLKKQVVRLKISHLLKNNKYILFYPASTVSKVNMQIDINFWNPNYFSSTTPLTTPTCGKSVLEVAGSDGMQAPHSILSKGVWHTYKSFLKKKASKLDAMISPTLKSRKIVSNGTYSQNINNQSTSTREGLSFVTEPTTPPSNLQITKDDKLGVSAQKMDEYNLTILFVKNKIARKAIFFPQNKMRLVEPIDLQNMSFQEAIASKKMRFVEPIDRRAFTAAFQGSIVLLGCQKLITFQEILKKYNRPIGGIYNARILDRFQIQRLAELENDKQSYKEFLSYIKMPSMKMLLSIKSRSSLFFLLFRQIQLLAILQIRSKQLSFI